MKVVIHGSPTRREIRLVTALAAGFRRHGVQVDVVSKGSRPPDFFGDLTVFVGVKGRKIRDACVAAQAPYLLIDKGYFHRNRYHRFSLNGFTPCYLGSGRDDSWRLLSLGIQPKGFKADLARKVTFVGFDNKYASFHNLGDANLYAETVNTTIKAIVQGTAFELHVRNRVDRASLPFSALLHQCHCVVVHGSIAAVEAIVAGVPVVSLGGREANVVHDLSSTELVSVLSPNRPSRKDVDKRLAELAWCQFNIEEITKGMPWNVLAEQYKRL